jgi:leucyl/phenylalanyl-tRNA---protein transferase
LYGGVMGRVFFGESMFAQRTDASKVAFVRLVQLLQRWRFALIDCQVTTAHLKRFGAREISREEFLEHLATATREATTRGSWSQFSEPPPDFA